MNGPRETQPATPLVAPVTKKRYTPPVLTVYGNLPQITASVGTTGLKDGGFGMTAVRTAP
jgi:hypothetical protein